MNANWVRDVGYLVGERRGKAKLKKKKRLVFKKPGRYIILMYLGKIVYAAM